MPKSHEVPQTAAGFFFQPVRAIRWLANAPDGAIVGIEYLDDVSLTAPGNLAIFEQDKFSGKKAPPLNNKNVELWKTLAIWARLAATNKQNMDRTRFVLATNRPLRPNWLVSEIAAAEDAPAARKVIKKITTLASKPSAASDYVAEVLRLPKSLLVKLIQNIDVETLVAANTAHSVTATMPVPPGVDREELFQGLLGWACSVAFNAWRQGNPALLHKSAFSTQLHNLIDKLKPGAKEASTKHAYDSISQVALETDHSEARYIRQLLIIELASQVQDAKKAYIAESKEILRLSSEGDLVGRDCAERDVRLHRHWQIQRQKAMLARENEVTQGKRIFFECIQHSAPYRNFTPIEPYMTEGAYHRLANIDPRDNEPYLGWHPDFEAILDGD